jgi:hypothetical protein
VTLEATRRGVVAATAVTLPLLAGGCRGISALGSPPAPQTDVALARAAIAGEALMIARYRAVLAAAPGLQGRLSPLLSQHEEHLARLRRRLIDPGSQGRASSPPPSGRPVPAAAGTSGPVGAAARTYGGALAYLRRAEAAAAATLIGRLQAASPSFAQLLASIAASEATHALVLGTPRRGA